MHPTQLSKGGCGALPLKSIVLYPPHSMVLGHTYSKGHRLRAAVDKDPTDIQIQCVKAIGRSLHKSSAN